MKEQSFICTTCGIEYEPSAVAPVDCKICLDDRQYVHPKGQSWTNLAALNSSYKNIIEKVTSDVYAVYSTPAFAIGQRAHLLITPNGNILWDCISNLDASTLELVKRLGGIDAIAISHPHYYTTMAQWSKAFNDVPVYLHATDEKWITRRDFNAVLWTEETKDILPGVTLINSGGHFPGGAILHYKDMLLVGDIIQVCPDLKSVSFMYSYPNMIPLPKRDILHIRESVKSFRYDAIYGAFGLYIKSGGEDVLQFSIDRYLKVYD